jgi:hypothetical protein
MKNTSVDAALRYLTKRNALPKLATPLPAIGSDARFASLCCRLMAGTRPQSVRPMPFVRVESTIQH